MRTRHQKTAVVGGVAQHRAADAVADGIAGKTQLRKDLDVIGQVVVELGEGLQAAGLGAQTALIDKAVAAVRASHKSVDHADGIGPTAKGIGDRVAAAGPASIAGLYGAIVAAGAGARIPARARIELLAAVVAGADKIVLAAKGAVLAVVIQEGGKAAAFEIAAEGAIELVGAVDGIAHFNAEFGALEAAAGDDIDHAAHRLRAVGGRRAVGQHLDPLDHVHRILVDIGEEKAVAGGNRRKPGAAAIDQGQGAAGA